MRRLWIPLRCFRLRKVWGKLMKELELLTILSNVKSEYILQAQALRSGRKKVPRAHPGKRILLIAAVISLLLLLVGCGAVLIGLQKISLGRVTIPQFSQPGWTVDLVSTNGYLNSGNYQATRDWIAFTSGYDADRSLEQNRDKSGYTAPEDYRIYNCYTEEMREEVDRICEKYRLQVAGPVYFAKEPDQVFSAVGISPAWKENAKVWDYSGAYYRSGSFYVAGKVEHRFEGRDRDDTLLFVYACDRKSVFFPDYVILQDRAGTDSWEATAWDGTPLILIQNQDRGVIVGDIGESYVSVTLNFRYSSSEGAVDAENPCSRQEFEAIANRFAYQITPREPDSQWLQHPNGLNDGQTENPTQTYGTYFEAWLPGSVGSEAYSPDYQQKFVDLDGDGLDEMLIWNARTGVVYEVVTQAEGQLQCVYGGGTYGSDDHEVQLYLCEGNILEKNNPHPTQGVQMNEYYRLENHRLTMVECVMESGDGKFYWSESGGASGAMWREITPEAYKESRGKYTRIGGTSETGTLGGLGADDPLLAVLRNECTFYRTDDGLEYTLEDYCRTEGERMGFPVYVTRFCLVDLDADAEPEAVADFQFGENREVMCMVLKHEPGGVYGTEFYYRQMSQLKENGTFAYSGGGDNDGWGRLRWENGTWVTETVGSMDYGDNQTDVQWYAYQREEGE